MSDFRRRLMCKKIESDLPKGYKKINYIESTGGQYINTGLYGGLDTFGIDFKFNGNVNSRYYILGNFNQVGQCGVMTSTSDKNKVNLVYFINNKAVPVIIGNSGDDIRITNKNYIIIANDVEMGIVSTNSMKLTNSTMCLFGTGIGTKFDGKGKVYYLKIYNNLEFENIVRNFVPALDTTNKPCLYDTVSKQPFYNQGTGEFLYG